MEACPCGSQRPLSLCCQPFLEELAIADTAEQLMRSRYTAYALGNADYIEKTEHEADRKAIEDWIRATEFKALRVLECHHGQPEDTQGVVIFEADFVSAGQSSTHRETSEFVRQDGRWMFLRGRQNPLRQTARTGRNDLCPCGSGKKYKKCCGP